MATKRKVKRFADGGSDETFGAEKQKFSNIGKFEEGPKEVTVDETDESGRGAMTPAQEANSKAVNAQSFRDAFAAARKAGDSKFTWAGKSYNTETKSAPAKSAPAKLSQSDLDSAYKYEQSKRKEGIAKAALDKALLTQAKEQQAKREAAKPQDPYVKSGYFPAYKKGGTTASSRADGIAQRGKTRGTIVACGGGYMKGKK